MMKKHTRVLGVLMAGMMAVSTAAIIPVNAADTADTGFRFQFSRNYQYDLNGNRKKDDDTSAYVYPSYVQNGKLNIETMGRNSYGDNKWRNYTLPVNDVYLKTGTEYSIQNKINEAGCDWTQLRSAAPYGHTANGKWSPDSVGYYSAPETY